jgi:hypothetical protein
MDPRMSFKQLVDETLTEGWERYHGFMTYLPSVGMEDWEFNQVFYYGLSQEVKEHINALPGGLLHAQHQKSASSFREAFC